MTHEKHGAWFALPNCPVTKCLSGYVHYHNPSANRLPFFKLFLGTVLSVVLMRLNTLEVLRPTCGPPPTFNALVTQSWICLCKGRHQASRHSLVMIMNGAREGSHTDPAASQMYQFTQPVFESAIWQLPNQCSSCKQQTDPNKSQSNPQR